MSIEHRVSVVIPVHNSEQFLGACLETVIHQTYKDIEIIVVDDNSSDGSEKIIRRYKKHDKRIKDFKVNHHNAALTRRDGIEHVTSRYICFVDSDDLLHPRYVEDLLGAIEKTGLEIATAKIANFTGMNNTNKEDDGSGNARVEGDISGYFFNNYHSKHNSRHIAQSINAKMFNRKVLKGIDYTVLRASVLEDNYIVPQVLKYVNPQKIAMVDRTLYYYRESQTSTMSKALSGPIKYGNSEVLYTELFEKAMDYIRNLYSDDKDIDDKINKIKIEEYYSLAESIVDKNVHINNIERELESLKSENTRLKSDINRLEVINRDIFRSKSYKLSLMIAKPVRFIGKRLGL